MEGISEATSNGQQTSNAQSKIITCKAAVVWAPGEPFILEDVEVEPPHKMEVRIKILFASICHTDLSAWKGENELQRAFPRILGHEAAGVVESVGEGVEDMKEGDHVVPIFNGECGDCAYCHSEKTNLCNKFRVNPFKSVMVGDGRTRFSVVDRRNGERRPVYHFLNTSTFAEYTVVDFACVVKINPEAPLDKMCLLSCGISTGVGAAWNTANVTKGSSVAIFGLGAVGLAVAEGARLRGASQIIGVDINPDKFAKGREMGITDFVNPKECSKPANEGWGFTVVLGIHLSPRLLPLHPMELFDGRRIIGCVFGDFKGKSELPNIVDKCMKGEININLDGFITHELPFAEINRAFQLLEEGKSLRCLLHL
ncbi:alcohol dehydrogenase-like 4 isoform X2 [Typha latifolia]|uniref:alcohol dehydrogenase-like 4 isoform X2 n=1 Tax=Typha latifolia TaxID=4733 RepID=UPI003C2E32D5